MRLRNPRAFVLLLSLLLVLAACGGGGDDGAAPDDGDGDTATTAAGGGTADDGTDDSGDDDDGSGGEFDPNSACIEATQAMSEAMNAYGTGLTGAVTGDLDTAQLEQAAGQLRALAESSPDEIKDDFTIIADELGEFYTALAESGFQVGQTPSPEQLATLTAVMESVDQQAIETAANNVSAWFEDNCEA